MEDRRETATSSPRPSDLPSAVVSPDTLLAVCAARLELVLDDFARSLESLEAAMASLPGAEGPPLLRTGRRPC